jgi:pyruvate formate lyase activating enzyme
MTTGQILHLQRLSTEDGPGIRTTVFFKGCPLHCAWCHNPESISMRMQTQWFSVRCLKCETCINACPNGCLTMTSDGLVINRESCQACGTCSEACPSGALEALGKTVTVEELLAELLKDRTFYENSGGGVTLSGGEPTMQPDFSEALLRALKENGIKTALDTCGVCSKQTLERLLPFIDLVLFDLKISNPERHVDHTGASNRQILENLTFIRDFRLAQRKQFEIWIRTPLIPGATDSDENILAIGQILADSMDGMITRWELCAFNNLCRDQYTRLGINWDYARTPLMTAFELAHCKQTAQESGFHPDLIIATGATRLIENL